VIDQFYARILSLTVAVAAMGPLCRAQEPAAPQRPVTDHPAEKGEVRSLVERYCVDCHSGPGRQGNLAIDRMLVDDANLSNADWERVARKLATRQMPPLDSQRPTEREYQIAVSALEKTLDSIAAESPNPGRTETLRRLNRTEYGNVIRDLLGLNIDTASLLPPDERSHGFDTVTVVDLSPTLLNRYLSAAEKISRLAVGRVPESVRGETFRIRPDVTQDVHIRGLPIGTRGGGVFRHYFPVDGEYEIQVRLMRDRNEEIEGLREAHELEVLLDRVRLALFSVKPPSKGSGHQTLDANFNCRVKAKAGDHAVAATFLKKPSSLLETTRQPLNVHFNYYRHPRIGPAVYEISVIGPFESTEAGETESRQRIFIERPSGQDTEEAVARKIVANLARKAYRRPLTEVDLKPLLKAFQEGRVSGDFEAGIESALSTILVNPNFLFRIEGDPSEVPPGSVYSISDVQLASRLSFLLWSSAPDEELLALAEQGTLRRPEVLESQVLRMLADQRSQSLITSFAAQWLHLSNIDAVNPDMRLYPDFDDNLRQSLRRETELLLEEIIRKDRSVLELLKAEHTFLDERLAKHYGVPHIYGSRFRRVELRESSDRGGLLRHGSILTLTSYATRTSPVIRGHWVLQNLIGSPPPPPPPDIPALDENIVSGSLTVRERLKQHSTDASCAVCHQQMDSIGFSLEEFDAVGRFRKKSDGRAIDARGGFVDGAEFDGVTGLEQALLNRPELFVRTLVEKLMVFGLGRGVESYDAPAVRKIVRDAREDNYRFSRLIIGLVKSPPFQMRKAP